MTGLLQSLAIALAVVGFQDADWNGLLARDTPTRMKTSAELQVAIHRDPTPLRDPKRQQILVEALEHENGVIIENLNAVSRGADPVIGETFSEHYSRLVEFAMSIFDALPPGTLRARLLQALAMGTYNPESRLAKRLALEGEALVDIVLTMAGSTNNPTRWNALSLIAMLFDHQRATGRALSSIDQERLTDAARAGLRNSDTGTRSYAIDAVVAARDRDSIPVLLELARADPDGAAALRPFTIRARAAAAAQKLRTLR